MLVRAIDSALASFADHSVEIIVVPNGKSDAWKIAKENYLHDERVKWLEIEKGHACSARNHGLKNAKGTYIRFLDDDDYLLSFSSDQLKNIIRNDADISIAPISVLEEAKGNIYLQEIPKTKDFVCASLLSISINNMTAGCIFKRTILKSSLWREDVILYDDYIWLIEIASKLEIKLISEITPVATYVQHDDYRLSRVRRTIENSKKLIDSILHLQENLIKTGRNSSERLSAIAAALLTHAHSVFPVDPLFFSELINKSLLIDKNARPLQPIFKNNNLLSKKIKLTEWLILPARYLTRAYRHYSWNVKK